jgi:DNA/RNA-binding domain of Phe-tRNA-synthetase-like protein
MKIIHVTLSDELKSNCPEMVLGVLCCEVVNSKSNEALWREIEEQQEIIKTGYRIETVKTQHNIAATRRVYKNCGKEPNRYRPSAEALYRRTLREIKLYRINTLVDLVNLFSLSTGYSIGGFDADLVEGDVVAGVGRNEEPFNAIGRGELNINGLPVLRDAKGAIGTPTSDEVRTAIRPDTTSFLMNINAYTGQAELEKHVDFFIDKLEQYVFAKSINFEIIR